MIWLLTKLGKIALHFFTGGAAEAVIGAWTKKKDDDAAEDEATIAARRDVQIAAANNPHLIIAGATAFLIWASGLAFFFGLTVPVTVECIQWLRYGDEVAFDLAPHQAWMIIASIGAGGLHTAAKLFKS